MKNKSRKDFDAVVFKRQAALRLHEKLKGMRPDQESRYWRRQNREFAARWEAASNPDQSRN